MNSPKPNAPKPKTTETILNFLQEAGQEGSARGKIIRELNLSTEQAKTALKTLKSTGECFTTSLRRAQSIVYFATSAFPEKSKEETILENQNKSKEMGSRRQMLEEAGATLREKGEPFNSDKLQKITGASKSAAYCYITDLLKNKDVVQIRKGVYRFKKTNPTQNPNQDPETHGEEPGTPETATNPGAAAAWKDGFAEGFAKGFATGRKERAE